MTTIGLISDTHGLLRPEVIQPLGGCQLILHAGDIGAPDVISELQRLAPVVAVRGNVDRDRWANRFPLTQAVEVAGTHVYVLHDVGELDLDPRTAGFQVVVFGHSHRPETIRRNGVLYVNPGSAGPRRFKLPVALAKLHLDNAEPRVEMIELKVS
jgi:uncharacterized protein